VNHALEGLGFRKILINSSLIVIIMVEKRGGKSDKFEGDLRVNELLLSLPYE
jgi:hypothetical protein